MRCPARSAARRGGQAAGGPAAPSGADRQLGSPLNARRDTRPPRQRKICRSGRCRHFVGGWRRRLIVSGARRSRAGTPRAAPLGRRWRGEAAPGGAALSGAPAGSPRTFLPRPPCAAPREIQRGCPAPLSPLPVGPGGVKGALAAAAACPSPPRPAGSASCRVWAWPAAAARASLALSLGRAAPLGLSPPTSPRTHTLPPPGRDGRRRSGAAGGALPHSPRQPPRRTASLPAGRQGLGGRGAPVGRPPRLFPEEGEAQLPPPPSPPSSSSSSSLAPSLPAPPRRERSAESPRRTDGPGGGTRTHNGAETHQQGERRGSSSACPPLPPRPSPLCSFFLIFGWVGFFPPFTPPRHPGRRGVTASGGRQPGSAGAGRGEAGRLAERGRAAAGSFRRGRGPAGAVRPLSPGLGPAPRRSARAPRVEGGGVCVCALGWGRGAAAPGDAQMSAQPGATPARRWRRRCSPPPHPRPPAGPDGAGTCVPEGLSVRSRPSPGQAASLSGRSLPSGVQLLSRIVRWRRVRLVRALSGISRFLQ